MAHLFSFPLSLLQLSSHLSEFRSRVLPSPEEFAAEKAARERQLDEVFAEAQRRESEWQQRVQRERAQMEANMQAKESFVAKAIAIHVSAGQRQMRDWRVVGRIYHLQITIQ